MTRTTSATKSSNAPLPAEDNRRGGANLTLLASAKPERLSKLAQTKLTPTEYQRLEAIRDELNSGEGSQVTISSLLRTFVVHGLRVAEEELRLNQ